MLPDKFYFYHKKAVFAISYDMYDKTVIVIKYYQEIYRQIRHYSFTQVYLYIQ